MTNPVTRVFLRLSCLLLGNQIINYTICTCVLWNSFWVQIPSSQISSPTCLSTAWESVTQGLVAQLWKGKYGLRKRLLHSAPQEMEIKGTAMTSNFSVQGP